MTPAIATVLVLLVVAVALFASEKIPIDVVTIMLVIGLVLTGTLTAGEAFAGFGNDIVITIGGLFIVAIHLSQVLYYLKASKRCLGLLINFNVRLLHRGIRRVIRTRRSRRLGGHNHLLLAL